MERVPKYDNPEETKDRIRDRTNPRKAKKRRFDDGPDPEKLRQIEKLAASKEKDSQNASHHSSATSTIVTNYTGGVMNDKHAKRAYVGNIPIDTDPVDLQCYLNISLRDAGGCLDPGNPILNASFVNLDKRFMFVELRSIEETTCLMQLDGIKYRQHYLKIRRPVDYEKNPIIPPSRPIPELDLAKLGIVSTQVEDSDFKLFVGNLSTTLDEEQIKKVLMRYGKLKSFHLVKEADGFRSKGYAFCEYSDEKSTDSALEYLNGYIVDNKALILKKAANMGIPLGVTGGASDGSDYDKMKSFIQEKQKQEEEERIKKQQEFERQRMFDLLKNYKPQQQDPLSPTANSPTDNAQSHSFTEETNRWDSGRAMGPSQEHYPPPPSHYPPPPSNYPQGPYSGPPGQRPGPPPPYPHYRPPPPGPHGNYPYPSQHNYPQGPTQRYPPPGYPNHPPPHSYPPPPNYNVPSSVPPPRPNDHFPQNYPQPPRAPPMPSESFKPLHPPPPSQNPTPTESRVIILSNILKLQDLEEDEEFEYTYDDIKTELGSYGKIIELIIPRPKDISEKYPRTALLKAFCKFDSIQEATKALEAMSKKAFDSQTVKAAYMQEHDFDTRNFA